MSDMFKVRGYNESDMVSFKISDLKRIVDELERQFNVFVDENRKLQESIDDNYKKMNENQIQCEFLRGGFKLIEKLMDNFASEDKIEEIEDMPEPNMKVSSVEFDEAPETIHIKTPGTVHVNVSENKELPKDNSETIPMFEKEEPKKEEVRVTVTSNTPTHKNPVAWDPNSSPTIFVQD